MYRQTIANRRAVCYNKNMIVFVIALESEARPVIEKMQITRDETVHSKRVVLGRICGADTAVVVCGVGKVNAAAGTQYAIDCLNADKIINVGVAGGLNSGMRVGEIYGIRAAVQYDFDLAELNHTPVGTLNEYDEPYLALDVVDLFEMKNLATADRFNDDKKDYNFITVGLGADVRDMEGGAIVHACKRAGVKCYSFKAISDLAGAGSTPQQFERNLAACAEKTGREIERIFLAVSRA